jgi:hypothetical protein
MRYLPVVKKDEVPEGPTSKDSWSRLGAPRLMPPAPPMDGRTDGRSTA